jgi:hypothetical protein
MRAPGATLGPPMSVGPGSNAGQRVSYYGTGAASPPMAYDEAEPRSPSRLRVALALVLGAIGLMLIGFGIVAIAMQLLQ